LPPQWQRLLIDGDNGSGKTTLANKLAAVLSAKIVTVDDHLLQNGDIYWKQIDYDALKAAISAAGEKVIIEGVCLLKVLEQADLRSDYHIFIKLYNGMVGWEYQHYLNERVKLPHSRLRRDIAQYYRDYRPFDVCNLVVERLL
jgi:adenylate kinase family enzyme